MASKSPGKQKKKKGGDDEAMEDTAANKSLSKGASNLAQRVVGSLFRSRSRVGDNSAEKKKISSTRLEAAYYGKRSDARDRSSEDPRRHQIPRASSPRGVVQEGEEDPPTAKPRVKLRKKSMEREKERRLSRERELERSKRDSSRDRSVKERSPSKTHSFRIERNVQLTPPMPPPRTRSMREQTPVEPLTSTPKKTPYQFWREQRMKEEETITTEEITTVTRKEEESTGAVRKQLFSSKLVPKDTTDQGADDRQESADDILARWKHERAKRERQASGGASSVASSSTAEPVSKAANITPSSVTTFVKRKSTISAMFQSLNKKKEEEEQKKYSVSALMTSTPLTRDFHDAVLHAEVKEASAGPIFGTVLHPVLPKPPTGRSDDWRSSGGHYFRASRPESPSVLAIRAKTPDPDYDSTSIGSGASSRSSQYRQQHQGSSSEDIRHLVGPQYNYGRSSSSAIGIPRYVAPKPRTSSLMSASPRLERPQSKELDSSSAFFGRHGAKLASAHSQQWYSDYSHKAFPHEAAFGDSPVGVYNYDGRIHLIKGT